MSSSKIQFGYVAQVEETLDEADAPYIAAANRVLQHDLLNKTTATYDSVSEVAVEAGNPFTVTMAAGAAQINLAAIPNPLVDGDSVDLTDLSPKIVVIRAHADNAGNVTIAAADTNGYDLGGEAILQPGETRIFDKLHNAAAVVASDERLIDVTGTGTDSIDVLIVAGELPPEE